MKGELSDGEEPVNPAQVRLGADSKETTACAAELTGVSVNECAPSVATAQARAEIALDQPVIAMTAEEQRAFWEALSAPVKLTVAQNKLGCLMRGEPPVNPPC